MFMCLCYNFSVFKQDSSTENLLLQNLGTLKVMWVCKFCTFMVYKILIKIYQECRQKKLFVY